MGQKLKTYQIQLTVKGPVFIGDGNQIQKKEYVFLNRNTIGVVIAYYFRYIIYSCIFWHKNCIYRMILSVLWLRIHVRI